MQVIRWDQADTDARAGILKDLGHTTRRGKLTARGKQLLEQSWGDFDKETRKAMLDHGVLYG